jgi:hypothetical protein
MPTSQETLSRWQSIASIGASIAIPLILAIFGYLVQNQIASEGLRKDYVQIAISILKENPTAQEKDLRAWAVKVLDENSPIPFSANVKTSLEKGFPLITHRFIFPDAPDGCMKQAEKLAFIPIFESATKKGYFDVPDVREFSIKLLKEAHKAENNTVSLTCLQDWVRAMKKITDDASTAAKPKPTK